MSSGPHAISAETRVRDYFIANPDEALLIDDMVVKFRLCRNRVYKVARRLRLKGFLQASRTIPVLYSRADVITDADLMLA